ncbi:uncharacterized protein LOC122503395 [Leptopilina heterotoma]|uniref:uncharacterized protein LOC122503395 n=1 Tax=Leptopilina heterotoma TaxID=63436 RepID=UPI001CA7D940|nr:uncharacterized protein LOC122503395 [Leptopilina heterotoma]
MVSLKIFFLLFLCTFMMVHSFPKLPKLKFLSKKSSKKLSSGEAAITKLDSSKPSALSLSSDESILEKGKKKLGKLKSGTLKKLTKLKDSISNSLSSSQEVSRPMTNRKKKRMRKMFTRAEAAKESLRKRHEKLEKERGRFERKKERLQRKKLSKAGKNLPKHSLTESIMENNSNISPPNRMKEMEKQLPFIDDDESMDAFE